MTVAASNGGHSGGRSVDLGRRCGHAVTVAMSVMVAVVMTVAVVVVLAVVVAVVVAVIVSMIMIAVVTIMVAAADLAYGCHFSQSGRKLKINLQR